MNLKPFPFFVSSFVIATFFWSVASVLSYQESKTPFLLPLILAGLSAPTLSALGMFLKARSPAVWHDFLHRLNPMRIRVQLLPLILGLMPCMLLLASGISLFFGGTWAQFSLSHLPDKALQDQSFLSVALITILLCSFEELGWRGYGIDSLRQRFSFFWTSVIFGTLWFLWHTPAFFIKNGYFHDEIWNRGILYVASYFLTLVAATFFINWVYFRNERSILAPILVHSSMNLYLAFLPLEPISRIILALLLVGFVIVLVSKETFLAAQNNIPEALSNEACLYSD